MKGKAILILAIGVITTQGAFARNRFPVFTENDNANVSNLDQFYRWLDDWGASGFAAVTDSAAKYIVLDTLAVSLVASHFQPRQQVFLDAALTVGLQQMDANNVITYTRFDGTNFDLSHGYGRGSGVVGELTPDNTLPDHRSVVKAIVGTHSSGYMYRAFATGSRFKTLPNNTPQGHLDSFSVMLRLLDYSGDTSATVATISTGPEGGAPQSSKNVTVGSFDNTTSYKRFTIPLTQVGDKFYPYEFKIYWNATKTLYLDSMKVFDNKGVLFDLLTRDSLAQVRTRVRNYYSDHADEDRAVGYISIMDEITGPEFQQYEKVKTILNSLGSTRAKEEAAVLGRYVGTDTSNTAAHSYFDAFVHYAQQSYFNFDDYFNACDVRTSSDGPWDHTNFQYDLENTFIPHLIIARKRAIANGTSFWVTVPTFAHYQCTGYNSQTQTYSECKLTERLYSPNEIRMVANLALLYGAKGIYYWEYMGRGGTAHQIAGKPEALPTKPEPQMEVWDDNFQNYSQALTGYGYSSTSCPTCPVLQNVAEPFTFKGLFSIQNGAAVRDTLWYFTREINKYLDSMAYFFLSATPLSTGHENQYLGNLSGSFIDSIKSAATYTKPWIQAGFFSKSGENYAFILNRRVDSNVCASIDTQTVKVYMHGTGIFEIWDVYANHADTVWDSAGIVRWNHFLNPGSAILIKKVTFLSASWSGGQCNNLYSTSGYYVDSMKTRTGADCAKFRVGYYLDNSQPRAYFANRITDTQTVSVYMHGQGIWELWDLQSNKADTVWDSAGIVKWRHLFEPNKPVLLKKSSFLGASWSGGQCDNLYSISGSTVDSMKTRSVSDCGKIRVGFYQDNGQPRAYFANHLTDTQTVSIFITGKGIWEVWDLNQNKADTLWDSLTVLRWSHLLQPNSPLLVKKLAIRSTWSGTVGVDRPWTWTWPRYSNIVLSGDITIPSGQSYTVGDGVTLRAMPNTDSLSNGFDSHKVEWIVNGTLRIQGSASRPAVFTSDNGSDSTWYGVRTVSGGKVVADYAQFKHGYSGVRILDTSPDTITNCVFEDCFMYGLYNSGNNNLCFRFNTVRLSTISPTYHQGSGYYANGLGTSARIAQSYFLNVRYGILCHSSSPHIDTCSFYFGSRVSNRAAILCEQISVPQVLKCDFDNYDYGVLTGYKSSGTLISYCHFHSSLTDFPNGTGKPLMHHGVTTDDMISDCKVRACCFEEIADNATENEFSYIDLGTTLDAGNNSFMTCHFRIQPDSTKEGYFPHYAILNWGETQLQARGNYFKPPSTGGQNLILNADTTYSRTTPYGGCGAVQPKMNAEEHKDLSLPNAFEVFANYPNPFNATTQISFTVPATTHVTIDIFNALGQKVATVADADYPVGNHVVSWMGTSDGGRVVSSGVYFYRVFAGDHTVTKKMLMLK